MRMSHQLIATRRDVPGDASTPSHRLLARAGLLERVAAGVYAHGPLLVRVLRRIEAIARQELDQRGCQEVRLPALQPRDLWDASGRWQRYANVDRLMFTLRDRTGATFGLAPTHEEMMVATFASAVTSYRQVPAILYQIQTKFRDELRARAGLLRAREFTMKDAYSFDIDADGMRDSYERMAQAYEAILARCGLEFVRVEADSGAMGGPESAEYVALCDSGEDVVALSDAGYRANLEVATTVPPPPDRAVAEHPMSRVATPGARSIEAVAAMLGDLPAARMVKTMLYEVGGEAQPVAVLCRGDRTINEVKLARALGASDLALAGEETVRRVTGAEPGFAGPVSLDKELRVIADRTVADVRGFVCGANETDAHLRDVWWERDLPVPELADLDLVQEGDTAPDGGRIRLARGIELAHIFQLGTRYTEALGVMVQDRHGRPRPLWMGSYGIGITRLAAAIVEQHHDEDGIAWPPAVAPHNVVIVQVRVGDPQQDAVAEQLYDQLRAAGVDVLWDDRDERAGVKFHDADLIGFPWRLTVGRRVSDGLVELTERRDRTSEVVAVADASHTLTERIPAAAALRP